MYSKPTLLFIFIFSFATASSQNIGTLLERYENIPANGKTVSYYFNESELTLLKDHFKSVTLPSETTMAGGEPSLYGAYLNTSEFGYVDIDDGRYFFPLAASSGTSDLESCGDVDPFDVDNAYVLTYENGEFYKLSVVDFQYELLGTIAPPTGQFWNGLEFDPTSGILYAIASDFSTVSTLCIIDKENLTFSVVGSNSTPGIVGIAIDLFGNMYGYEVVNDNFLEIDKDNAAVEIIGNIGFDANFAQDLEWHNTDDGDSLYMMCFNADIADTEIRRVNVSTGTTFVVDQVEPDTPMSEFPWASIIQETLLSNNSFEKNQISLHPNPVGEKLYINNMEGSTVVSLTNELGQEIRRDAHLVNGQIDVGDLSSGIYFLNIKANQEITTIKFIKE